MKIFYLSIIFTLTLQCVFSQSSGTLQGFAYKHDFQKDRDNRALQEQLDMQAQQMKDERERELYAETKEKAKVCSNQIKKLYSTFQKFPRQFTDGWYNVAVTNYFDLCVERKVYVINNKITKYFIDDYAERLVAYSSSIENGLAYIKLNLDGTLTEINDVYFLENIIDPNTITSKPMYGTFSFYTNFKRAGYVDIYVDNKFVGTLKNRYFPDDMSPACGQENGTVTFTYKPGIYNFKAISDTREWSGQITIVADNCRMISLTR